MIHICWIQARNMNLGTQSPRTNKKLLFYFYKPQVLSSFM
ncbi:uncharacterized protein METZ01_LOCUS290828, partial [marine metagenome]